MGKFYRLFLGGWVGLVYAGSDRFLLNVRTKLDEEIMLELCRLFIKKPNFFHVLWKKLTYTDVTTDFLVCYSFVVIINCVVTLLLSFYNDNKTLKDDVSIPYSAYKMFGTINQINSFSMIQTQFKKGMLIKSQLK